MNTGPAQAADNSGVEDAAFARFDLDVIRAHLMMVHQRAAGVDGELVVCCYGEDPLRRNPKTGKLGCPVHRQVGRFRPGDLEAMIGAVMAWDGVRHANVYVPLHLVRRGLAPGKRGEAADIVAVLGLVADLDADTGKAGAAMPIEPSFVLETSPGNRQPFILFDLPISASDAEPLARALQRATGSDSGTADVAHVWRVPGTLNWPNAKKVSERARPLAPALVTLSKTWDGSLVPVDQVRAALASWQEEPKTEAPGSDHGSANAEAIFRRLPPKTQFDLGATPPAGTDRSSHCMRVLKALIHAGLTDGEIQIVTAAFPNGLFGRYYAEGKDLAAEIRRAREHERQSHAGADRQWPVPKPLPSGLRPVASFDTDMIPASIGPWVADISDRMQCPPDYVAVSGVVALASVLGRKIAVRPQLETDWVEVPNLWGCIVGRPGAMKSPAMAEALKPLNRLEAGVRELNAAEAKRYAVAVEAHKLRKDEAHKSARAALKGGARDVTGILDVDEPEKPPARRYIANDCTYEALGEILSENPNGVLTFRDELVSLLKTLDREENAAARGFFLTAWNGKDGYTFDRIIRGLTHIDAACVSLLGSTQPGRLADYLSRAVKGSAGDDGLIQRFSLLVWPDDPGAWKEVDRYPDTEAKRAAWDTFTRLDQLTAADAGATREEFDKFPFLRLDEAARATFREWRSDLEGRLRTGGMHAALESAFAKYRKLVPSLALINHLADHGHGPITEVAMLRALSFADYLDTHARRAYGSGLQAEAATAKAIVGRIRKGDIAGEFTARDILQRDWSNLSDKEQVVAGLDLLDDLGWVASRKVDTGGRPKVLYTVNPRGLA